MGNDLQRDVETGQRRAMGALARTLDADVLVQVSARPTRQTSRGLELRMVAEAINVRGGESIGRAVVDMPPPLDKPRINKFTRFLARVLMDRMSGTWENMPAPGDNAEPSAPRSDTGANRPTPAPPPSAPGEVTTVPAPQSTTTAPAAPAAAPTTEPSAPPPARLPGPRIENVPPPPETTPAQPSR
jgi:hypothetical protein